ncbi:NUDIX hydrolase [Streptomyces cucumeris]|uniref:NUDIX hydrolase n=1 Tax=Streptomyces cucumeris TaxID=2962890 RepID=UPI003D720E64
MLVTAVIVHDTASNRVTLLQLSNQAKFAQGMWDLLGGKSEPGEPITETAVRELHEETWADRHAGAAEGRPHHPRGLGHGGSHDFFTVVFAAQEWTGDPRPRAVQAHAGLLDRCQRQPCAGREHNLERPPPLPHGWSGSLPRRLGIGTVDALDEPKRSPKPHRRSARMPDIRSRPRIC